MSKANQQRLDQINAIVEEYQAEGYVLTLRPLRMGKRLRYFIWEILTPRDWI